MVKISHINLDKEGLCKFMSPFEEKILKTLWTEGSLTSTQIQQCLIENNKIMRIATVSGLLNRLMDAGYVSREAVNVDSKHRYIYTAKIGEKEIAEMISHNILEHLKEVFGNDFYESIQSFIAKNVNEIPQIADEYSSLAQLARDTG